MLRCNYIFCIHYGPVIERSYAILILIEVDPKKSYLLSCNYGLTSLLNSDDKHRPYFHERLFRWFSHWYPEFHRHSRFPHSFKSKAIGNIQCNWRDANLGRFSSLALTPTIDLTWFDQLALIIPLMAYVFCYTRTPSASTAITLTNWFKWARAPLMNHNLIRWRENTATDYFIDSINCLKQP